MNKALIHETPVKVMALLGTALFSLAFMFGVSVTNASFDKMETPIADPFSAQRIVSVIDNAASGYSKLLSANFINPLVSDYKIYGENLAWIAKESRLSYYMGLEGYTGPKNAQGKVAGAFTLAGQAGEPKDNSLIADVFSVLIR
jgi:hypothetical protein